MKAVRRCVPAVALLLAACASPPLVSTLPAQPQRVDLVGRSIAALSPQAAAAQLATQAVDLRRRLPAAASVKAPVGALRLRLDPDELFATGSAQLEPEALAPCSELAMSLLAFDGTVLHVLAYGEADAAEPEAALGARRAASLLDYLARRGVPPTRLRAEGRGASAGNERVELVIVPVIQGHEAQAWVPPADVDG